MFINPRSEQEQTMLRFPRVSSARGRRFAESTLGLRHLSGADRRYAVGKGAGSEHAVHFRPVGLLDGHVRVANVMAFDLDLEVRASVAIDVAPRPWSLSVRDLKETANRPRGGGRRARDDREAWLPAVAVSASMPASRGDHRAEQRIVSPSAAVVDRNLNVSCPCRRP